jgi:hypothetical protein
MRCQIWHDGEQELKTGGMCWQIRQEVWKQDIAGGLILQIWHGAQKEPMAGVLIWQIWLALRAWGLRQ